MDGEPQSGPPKRSLADGDRRLVDAEEGVPHNERAVPRRTVDRDRARTPLLHEGKRGVRGQFYRYNLVIPELARTIVQSDRRTTGSAERSGRIDVGRTEDPATGPDEGRVGDDDLNLEEGPDQDAVLRDVSDVRTADRGRVEVVGLEGNRADSICVTARNSASFLHIRLGATQSCGETLTRRATRRDEGTVRGGRKRGCVGISEGTPECLLPKPDNALLKIERGCSCHSAVSK
ncbi:MAG: hypothetical protein KAJ19_15285 [Gammaproteobacteria bacterium]|nr:hypothetical protein [Gammaproteobacteria bacterium]